MRQLVLVSVEDRMSLADVYMNSTKEERIKIATAFYKARALELREVFDRRMRDLRRSFANDIARAIESEKDD